MSSAGRRPSERAFGLSVGMAALVFGGWLTWRGHGRAAAVAATLGVVLVCGGWLAPAALRIPNRVWWRFATLLGWVNSRMLLTIFFFLVLTPVGCVMRLVGRSPLRAIGGNTNWSRYDAGRRDARHFDHLY